MKRLLFLFFLIVFLAMFSVGQEVPEMNFEELIPWPNKINDTTYVVNFWATWCKPRVEELPYFQEAVNELKDEKMKFIFVSLDFPTQKEDRLIHII